MVLFTYHRFSPEMFSHSKGVIINGGTFTQYGRHSSEIRSRKGRRTGKNENRGRRTEVPVYGAHKLGNTKRKMKIGGDSLIRGYKSTVCD